MRKSEIEAIKLEDVALLILQLCDNRIDSFTLKTVATNEALTEDENFYNKIECENKPSITDVMKVLASYKAELEVQRVRSDIEYYKSFPNYLDALYEAGMRWKNAWVDGLPPIITEDSEINAHYKQVVADYQAKIDAKEEMKRKVELGKAYFKACQDTLGLIAGINTQKELTVEEIDEIETLHADILNALNTGRADKAIQLLTIAEPIHYTQVEIDLIKDYLLGELSGVSVIG